MATITLSGNGYAGSFSNTAFQSLNMNFNNVKQKSSNLVSSLKSLKDKVNNVVAVANAETSGNSISQTVNNVVNREESKKSNLSVAYEKLDKLLSEAVSVDNKAAEKINQLKNDFYKKYSYLKPECEKGLFEKIKDYLWDKVCKIAKVIADIAVKVFDWLKKHWVELLIGLTCIVIGALITVLTGGAATFLAAFAAGLAKAVLFSAITGAISGVATFLGGLLTGMSMDEALNAALTAFGDSFASAFVTAGLTFAGAAFGEGIGTTYESFKKIQQASKAIPYIKKCLNGLENISKITSFVMPDSDMAKILDGITSSKYYEIIKKGVDYASIFVDSAAKNSVILDDSYKKDGEKLPNVRYRSPTGRNGAIYETDKDGKVKIEKFRKESQSDRKHGNIDVGIGGGYEKYKMGDENKWEYDGFDSDIYNTKKIVDDFKSQAKDVFLGKNEYIFKKDSDSSPINIMGIQIPKINTPVLIIPDFNSIHNILPAMAPSV